MSLDRPAFHSVSVSPVPHYAFHFSCLSSLSGFECFWVYDPWLLYIVCLVSLFYEFMFFTHHIAKLLKAGAIGKDISSQP